LRGRRRQAGDAAREVAQLEFRPASSSFGASAAVVIEFLAVRRGWRDFRIAH
jgi:hypothetical protein